MDATLAPYQPLDDADARDAARQILGDSIDHVLTGDWHQALTDTAALWANNTPQTAAQHLIDTLTAAITDPTIPVEQVKAAAQNAHTVIEATGGDYEAAFRNTHN
ncbi:hypothetical protein AB0L71_28120 [Streptomyces sp. NPDC052052]|uniref:hypothetical protein n=1 Tax=Streptomyces sp. NPDC052052 TaxID=3154756 RepID=UPI003438408C